MLKGYESATPTTKSADVEAGQQGAPRPHKALAGTAEYLLQLEDKRAVKVIKLHVALETYA